MKPSLAEREILALELSNARLLAGVSKSRIAREAKVSHVLVGYVETGHINPSPRLLKAYARLCLKNSDALLLTWGCTPADVLEKLRARPSLCEMVRAA